MSQVLHIIVNINVVVGRFNGNATIGFGQKSQHNILVGYAKHRKIAAIQHEYVHWNDKQMDRLTVPTKNLHGWR